VSCGSPDLSSGMAVLPSIDFVVASCIAVYIDL
jgi:hypothetical protein